MGREITFFFPLEMNFTDAMCTLETLLETGKFTETPHIEKVKEESNGNQTDDI